MMVGKNLKENLNDISFLCHKINKKNQIEQEKVYKNSA
jgi:hypothetical protein